MFDTLWGINPLSRVGTAKHVMEERVSSTLSVRNHNVSIQNVNQPSADTALLQCISWRSIGQHKIDEQNHITGHYLYVAEVTNGSNNLWSRALG
jgi:hypothetical protein